VAAGLNWRIDIVMRLEKDGRTVFAEDRIRVKILSKKNAGRDDAVFSFLMKLPQSLSATHLLKRICAYSKNQSSYCFL